MVKVNYGWYVITKIDNSQERPLTLTRKGGAGVYFYHEVLDFELQE